MRGLLDAGWTVTAAEQVLRFGDGNPFHFDMQTGELVYQQVGKRGGGAGGRGRQLKYQVVPPAGCPEHVEPTPPCCFPAPPCPRLPQPRMTTSSGQVVPGGLRMVLDLGELPDGTARPIDFLLQQRSDYSQNRMRRPTARQIEQARQLVSLLDGAVLMDDRASGSGGLGGVLHGRRGNTQHIAASVSLDLAQPQNKAPGSARIQGGDWDAAQRITFFFHPTDPHGHTLGMHDSGARRGMGGGRASGPGTAAERAELRTAEAAAALGVALPANGAAAQEAAAPEQMHCYWCHALSPGGTIGWVKMALEGTTMQRKQPAGIKRRLCNACKVVHYKAGLTGPRPAAALCPGCNGCS